MSWVWKDVLSDYCGRQVGNSEEQRAKTESHGNVLKECQHAASPRLLLANSLASLSPREGLLLPQSAKLILRTCRCQATAGNSRVNLLC